MKDVQSKVYLDYVNKKLYYYRKSNTSIDISFLDYDGVLLKKISFPEGNVSAFTVFGDFLYLQKMDTRVIQEMNVSTGVVYRNISLPKAFPRLIDLAIVERSQYPTGKIKTICLCHIRLHKILNFRSGCAKVEVPNFLKLNLDWLQNSGNRL